MKIIIISLNCKKIDYLYFFRIWLYLWRIIFKCKQSTTFRSMPCCELITFNLDGFGVTCRVSFHMITSDPHWMSIHSLTREFFGQAFVLELQAQPISLTSDELDYHYMYVTKITDLMGGNY